MLTRETMVAVRRRLVLVDKAYLVIISKED